MEGFFSSFEPILKKYKTEVVLISIALTIAVVSLLILNSGKEKIIKAEVPSLIKKNLKPVAKNIIIDLSGSVEKPDVYEISSGARLKDILILAGGLSQDADRDFFAKNFNLARLVNDQEKIYIPGYEETQSASLVSTNLSVQAGQTNIFGASNKVNINTGTDTQLDTLPGIGEVTAKKIIQNRPYQTIEELLTKKAIGKAVFEKIKDLIEI